MTTTPNLGLPRLIAAQAQKHVTMNEALERVDALAQLAILDAELTAPPSAPSNGDRYIVASGSTGDWTGHTGEIAAWQNGIWVFYPPQEGWLAFVIASNAFIVFRDGAWRPSFGAGGNVQFDTLGIGTEPQNGVTLVAEGDSSLFTASNADHRVTVNRASDAGTASLILSTAHQASAEITQNPQGFQIKIARASGELVPALSAAFSGSQTLVGVGTATPERTLHVSANFGEMIFENAGGQANVKRFNVFLYEGGTAFRGLNDAGTNGTTWLYAKNDSGAVGLGTFTPTAGHLLDVAGSIRCTSVTQSSGSAGKEIFGQSPGLRFIEALRPVAFRWIEQPDDTGERVVPEVDGAASRQETLVLKRGRPSGKRTHLGLIAEEVKAVADSLDLDFAGYKSRRVAEPDAPDEHLLDYSEFVAPLIRSVQELSARVSALEASRTRS